MKTFFFELTPKRSLHDRCGRKFAGKSCTKTFRASLGKLGKILRTPKICLLLHMMKRHLRPRCPLLKEQKWKRPVMPPFSGVPVHTFYTHSLYS